MSLLRKFLNMRRKNFRKRSREDETEKGNESDDNEEERRMALEEIKFLQKQRERKSGIAAILSLNNQTDGVIGHLKSSTDKNSNEGVGLGSGDGEKEELVLQDTFAQETAVLEEDPNMLKYVEQELAKKKGKNIDAADQVENDLKRAEDELYIIPEHLKGVIYDALKSLDIMTQKLGSCFSCLKMLRSVCSSQMEGGIFHRKTGSLGPRKIVIDRRKSGVEVDKTITEHHNVFADLVDGVDVAEDRTHIKNPIVSRDKQDKNHDRREKVSNGQTGVNSEILFSEIELVGVLVPYTSMLDQQIDGDGKD
ncbi:hypothetical protein IFM89_020163 [Coptis chinensis]|uniref:Uncharacterized protein n=1 Tax=Coptis chinensis TaxID=261450 RepID=A0A835H558_9MAGN|nr:hypothetical protein IFM89_020163 [Coptis chinensis]